MAKKLIHKYTFVPATNLIIIPEIIAQKRFLLITNVKDNQVIFTFNSTTAGMAGITHSTTHKTTNITLDYNCSSMSADDELQIFVEEDKVTFAPSETYSDPVSKLRVSTPENLIDTDFEYGLQPSKWETLELVKNIPTFFSRDGDTGLTILSMDITNGSLEVSVSLEDEHGFSPGAPIIVKGSKLNSCNGAFVVTSTPTTKNFSYKSKQTQTTTGSINDIYTEIYYGSVYQGTEFKLSNLDSIVTDGANPSVLTAKTDAATDFNIGTSFFLTNSLGTENFTFDATTAKTNIAKTADVAITIATDTSLLGRRRANGYQPYMYQALNSIQFLPSQVTLNSSTNIITIANHGLTDRMGYLWSSGLGNQFGGIAVNTSSATLNAYREKVFYVRVVDANTFYLSEYWNSTTKYSLQSNTVVDGGLFKLELLPAYFPNEFSYGNFRFYFETLFNGGTSTDSRVRNVGTIPTYWFGTTTSHTSGPANPGQADYAYPTENYAADGGMYHVIQWGDANDAAYITNSCSNGLHRYTYTGSDASSYTYAQVMEYYQYSTSTTSCLMRATVDVGSSTYSSSRYNNQYNLHIHSSLHARNAAIVPVIYNTDHGKFYQPSHNFKKGEYYFFSKNDGTYTDQTTSASVQYRSNHIPVTQGGTSLYDGSNTTSGISGQVFRVHETDTTGFYLGSSTNIATVVRPQGANSIGQSVTMKHYPTKTNINAQNSLSKQPYANTEEDFSTISMPSNTITDSDPLVYNNLGNTTIGGLVNGTQYYATQSTTDRIRLASGTVGVHPWGFNPDDNTTETRGYSVGYIDASAYTASTGYYYYTDTDRLRFHYLYGPGHGFNTGDLVYYEEENGPILGLVSGRYYYFRKYGLTSTDQFQLFYDKDLAIRDYTSNPVTDFSQNMPVGRIKLWQYHNNWNSLKGKFRRVTTMDLTSAGTGTQQLSNTSLGGSDGVYKISAVTDNKTYSLASTGQIEARTLPIVSRTNVDLQSNIIYKLDHGLTSGTSLTVDNSSIGGLTSGTTYYAINAGKSWFQVATTLTDALTSNAISLTTTSTATTTFSTASLAGQGVGDGTVSCTSGEVAITGVGTNFPSKYSVGDKFKLVKTQVLTAKGVTSLGTNTFTSSGHALADGAALYVNCGTAPSNLVNGWIVYAGNVTTNTFTVHLTHDDGVAGTNTVTTSGGVALSFNAITSHDSYEEGTIKYVNNTLSLELAAAASQTLTDTNYMIETALLVRADGFAQHRPYDGGVELIPSTNPDSQMIRQTRKYFRYQSGKGIQNSLAINFSPTTDVDTFSANGNVGTIHTRYAHRLSEDLNVTFTGATVSSGANPYTGSYKVESVPTPNSFTINFDTAFTLNEAKTLVKGETITQLNSGATGIVRDDTRILLVPGASTSVTIQSITGTFTTNSADTLTGSTAGALSTYPTALAPVVPTDLEADGIIGFTVDSWNNSVLRAGLFDDQNGLFWEFNGQSLHCVVRTSTQQISGTVTATFKSAEVTGVGTKFSSQLNVNDRIIIKGQTYRITAIGSNTSLTIIPSYRGVTNDAIIVTKTVDNSVPQSNWNIDKCDGTGPSGFVLDKTKIHMSYIDYSWYGAGKVRFGFKDQNGNVMYVHQFVHNNLQTEAYMRSGNVPGRYEIENTGIPTYVPALAHWGTSVIMDGRFDNDKAYVFTASGNNHTITGGSSIVVSGTIDQTSSYYIRATNSKYYWSGYGITVATPSAEYNSITPNIEVTGTGLNAGNTTRNPSYLISPQQPYQAGVRVSTSWTGSNSSIKNLIMLNQQPSATQGSPTNYTFTLSTTGVSVTEEVPLISIRLAPSVDNGTPGLLGEREIINRMQLALKQVGILSTHSAEILIKLNGNIDNNDWQRVTVPSLSQLVYHSSTDTITGGNTIFSFRAQGGTGASGRTAVTTTQDLSEISDLGNSILGGDNVFPDGPDVITLVARLVEDPSAVSSSNPFQISGRLSWAESQA